VTTTEDLKCLILVLEDIEEIRDGLSKLLKVDGYRVELARTLEDAILKAIRQPPDLILVCLAGSTTSIIQVAIQIRQGAELKKDIPIVFFDVGEVDEGAEVALEDNLYLTKPDNFNQLRALLRKLLISKTLTP
jgi:DNA-binding response OmpR family regulator